MGAVINFPCFQQYISNTIPERWKETWSRSLQLPCLDLPSLGSWVWPSQPEQTRYVDGLCSQSCSWVTINQMFSRAMQAARPPSLANLSSLLLVAGTAHTRMLILWSPGNLQSLRASLPTRIRITGPGCEVEMCGWTTASEFCLISTLRAQPGVYGEHSCGSDYLYHFAPFIWPRWKRRWNVKPPQALFYTNKTCFVWAEDPSGCFTVWCWPAFINGHNTYTDIQMQITKKKT